MGLDRRTPGHLRIVSTSSPAKPQKPIDSETPKEKLSNGIRRMQEAMRANMDPGRGLPDKETLDELYAVLDDEGFLTAQNWLERPH
jgi:hypothetical protein